jgi:hypothetical protein
MPKIELTDEQVEELRDAIYVVMDSTDGYMRSCEEGDPNYLECAHKKSVLSDILHLLEIA